MVPTKSHAEAFHTQPPNNTQTTMAHNIMNTTITQSRTYIVPLGIQRESLHATLFQSKDEQRGRRVEAVARRAHILGGLQHGPDHGGGICSIVVAVVVVVRAIVVPAKDAKEGSRAHAGIGVAAAVEGIQDEQRRRAVVSLIIRIIILVVVQPAHLRNEHARLVFGGRFLPNVNRGPHHVAAFSGISQSVLQHERAELVEPLHGFQALVTITAQL